MADDLEALFDEANGDLALGELESAVEKYRQCVALDGDFYDGWHALGMALLKLERYPEALEVLEKAIALNPNDQFGWTSLSICHQRAGHIPEAEAAAGKARILSWGGKIKRDDENPPLTVN